jgi:ABC-type phosphate transport system substrate-binding protein
MLLKKIPQALAKAYIKCYHVKLQLPMYNELMEKVTWMQPILEEIRPELFLPDNETSCESENLEVIQIIPTPYPRYSCISNDPLKCEKASPVSEDNTRIKNCSLCGFPTLLPEKSEIKGTNGLYRIEKYLTRRGVGRLYSAIQIGTNQPVVIKEYLLPARYFSEQEQRLAMQAFQNFAGITLADGRILDFRIIKPSDAIADILEQRCYLVMEVENIGASLNNYLTQEAFTPTKVRLLLQQVLQTLEFLHTQKFRFPSGQVEQGIVHGNINLDSLLTTSSTSSSFIYLCDLAVWENIFLPASAKPNVLTKSQDLVDLGNVAFYLLNGKAVTDNKEQLDPRDERNWQGVDRHLKMFILRLMGIESAFDNTSIARLELLRLPEEIIKPATGQFNNILEEPPIKLPRIPSTAIFIGAISVGVVGLIAWLTVIKPQTSNATINIPQPCCIKDIAAIPPGQFTYVLPNNGIAHYVLKEPNLIAKGQTLEQNIFSAQPKLQLAYKPVDSIREAISKVQSGEAEFTIIPLIQPLPSDLTAQIIAYDALAPFVAFSYSQRQKGLPDNLNGKITLEQLHQLYKEQVTNWQELTKSNSLKIPVNLYAPQNPEAIEIFTQKVFARDRTANTKKLTDISTLTILPELEMMRTVIRDFETKEAGGIGFTSLSKIIGQCSVYPLAIQPPGEWPQQPVKLKNGKNIDPSTDLCDKKGSYFPNAELLKTGKYPLAYPIAVIYPRDNNRSTIGEKFAQILKTQEGQKLLAKTGLTGLE